MGIKEELSQVVDADEMFEIKERPRNLIYEDTRILTRQYPTKECQPSTKLWDHVMYKVESELEPTIYEEVVTDKEWWLVIQNEVESIKNDTWELVDPLDDKQAITTRWIFKAKRGALGEVEKFKARLVACGFQQTEGVDYFDTYALVVCWSTIRTIIVIIVKKRWSIKHFDIKIWKHWGGGVHACAKRTSWARN